MVALIALLVVVAAVSWLAFPLARWANHDPDARIPGNGYFGTDRRPVGRIEGPTFDHAVPPSLECDTIARELDPVQLLLRFDDAPC